LSDLAADILHCVRPVIKLDILKGMLSEALFQRMLRLQGLYSQRVLKYVHTKVLKIVRCKKYKILFLRYCDKIFKNSL